MNTLAQYRAMLRIDKHRLDDELEIQAEYQDRIGSEVARANTRMLEAKDELARTEARLSDDIRDRIPKATIDAIRGQVFRSAERRDAWRAYQQARELYEEWSSLHSAWIAKGYKLGDLGHLFGSDYFALKSVSRRDPSAPDEGKREALRRASDERSTRGRSRL